MDCPTENIERYFDETNKHIDDVIKSGGAVFVHCLVGMSRSSTIVIAYLISKGMNFKQAFELCKRKHQITNPNYGF